VRTPPSPGKGHIGGESSQRRRQSNDNSLPGLSAQHGEMALTCSCRSASLHWGGAPSSGIAVCGRGVEGKIVKLVKLKF